MLVRKITLDDYLDAKRISNVAFEIPHPLPSTSGELVRQAEENPASSAEQHWQERYAAFDDGGKMMASMAVTPFTAYFDGSEIAINGIGDVSTLPQYRRAGAIRSCFEAALEDMFQNGDVFSYLYPFSYYFYRKFGYELSAETTFWKLSLNALPKLGTSGSLDMFETGSNISLFSQVYENFAKTLNMMLRRDEVLWKRRMTGFDPYNSKQWSFVWKNCEDVPKGYLTYQSDMINGERIMTVRDFCFTDLEGLSALIEFLSTFSSQYKHAVVPLPDAYSLCGILPELAYGNVTREKTFTGMVRVVNVKRALELAKYKGRGRFVIGVEDVTIPQNTGFYAVEFDENGVKVTITDEEPDIETDIQNFGRLITGALGIDECMIYPKVKINSNLAALQNSFYKKPLWINDYF